MALRIGLGLSLGLSGVGLPAPAAPVITAPVSTGGNSVLLVGAAYTFAGTCEDGCTVELYRNAVLHGSAAVVGTAWTYARTPLLAEKGAESWTAVATRTIGGQVSAASAAVTPRVANAYLRVRANDPASYTRSGGSLLSLVNQVSGVAASTVTGAPGWSADADGSGKAGFTFNGTSAVDGTEAAVLSGLGTTEKAAAMIAVVRLAGLDATAAIFSSALSSAALDGTAGFWQFNTGAGKYAWYRQNATTAKTFDSEDTAAGIQVVRFRTTDGLTWFMRKGAGAESSETLTALTTTAADRFSFGSWAKSVRANFFTGTIHEILMLVDHEDSTTMDDLYTRIAADWI